MDTQNDINLVILILVLLIGLFASNFISIISHIIPTINIIQKNLKKNYKMGSIVSSNDVGWMISSIICTVSFCLLYKFNKQYTLVFICFVIFLFFVVCGLYIYFIEPLFEKNHKIVKRIGFLVLRIFPFTLEYNYAKKCKLAVKLESQDYNSLFQRFLCSILVKQFNVINLIVAIVLWIICFLVLRYFEFPVLILFSFVLSRLIGRSCEIIRAFFQDVTQTKKNNTNLTAGDRIKLTVSSFFEIIILNSILYTMMIPIPKKEEEVVYKGLLNFITIIRDMPKENYSFNNQLSNVFRSFGVMTYKSVEFDDNLFINLIIALQVLTSMVLIIFSVAKYIGNLNNKEISLSGKDLKKWQNTDGSQKVSVKKFYYAINILRPTVNSAFQKYGLNYYNVDKEDNINLLFSIIDKDNKYTIERNVLKHIFQLEKLYLTYDIKKIYEFDIKIIYHLRNIIIILRNIESNAKQN